MVDGINAYGSVKERIAAAAMKAGRPPESVTLVAVTKTHGLERIRPLLEQGHRVFGENRVQEAEGKWPELRKSFPDIELHLIGPLQSNKAKEAVALFDVIESVDREKIAAALAAEMKRQHKSPKLYVQVNTGLEPQKAGVAPSEVGEFLKRIRQEYDLKPEGLMCIPPAEEQPAQHFALLANLARENGLAVISMGMSGDYDEAITQGATHVRVGSALFGARH
jgi:pyridoxal phosphate enzyme (YggS family)